MKFWSDALIAHAYLLLSGVSEGEYLPRHHRQYGRASCGPVAPIRPGSRETFD
jgi:hypothetical protein